MKLLVSIALYCNEIMKHRIDNLYKIIDNYLNNYPIEVFISIETNSKKITGVIFDKYFDELFTKRLKINIHEISFMKHPFDLTKMHREIFKKNIYKYDYFMYIEDDILIPYNSFAEYVEKFEDLHKLEFFPGLIRLEKKDDIFYSTDNTMVHHIYNKDIITINNRRYFKINNPYCACWIAPKEFLKNAINDANSKFIHTNTHEYIREEMANFLDKGLSMTSLVELDNKNKIHANCFIYHLTNNYVGKSYGFGSIPVNKLVFVRDK